MSDSQPNHLRRTCAWCQREAGVKPSDGETHTICERHLAEMRRDLDGEFNRPLLEGPYPNNLDDGSWKAKYWLVLILGALLLLAILLTS